MSPTGSALLLAVCAAAAPATESAPAHAGAGAADAPTSESPSGTGETPADQKGRDTEETSPEPGEPAGEQRADTESDSTASPESPVAEVEAADCPEPVSTCPGFTVSIGPRAGGSLYGDQWVVGGDVRLALHCLGGLGVTAVGIVGLAGNYSTWRPSLRIDYLHWFESIGLGVYLTFGPSFIHFEPVGDFAKWCHRHEVDACSGLDWGIEVGGGWRYGWLGLEAIGGLYGLPSLTFVTRISFPLWSSHPSERS